MGRWSHLDCDHERLPDGLTRVGYDADTGIYSYQDEHGDFWEGMPGRQYGTLHRVGSTALGRSKEREPVKTDNDQSDDELMAWEDLDIDEKTFEAHGRQRRHSNASTAKKHTKTRHRAGTLSSLAEYFHLHHSQPEPVAPEASLPNASSDEKGTGEPRRLKRAVTFDQILGRGM